MKTVMKGIIFGALASYSIIVVIGLLTAPGAPQFTSGAYPPAPADHVPAKPRGLVLRDNPAIECDYKAAELARIVFEAREAGATERQVLAKFAELKLYGDGYIVDLVFQSPADTPKWMIVGEAIRECKRRNGEREA